MSASSKFNQVFTKKHLKQLYQNNIRFKSTSGVDRVNKNSFESSLDNNIDIIYRKVRQGNYKFSQYKEKLVSRGAVREPRVLSIPTIRDKLTQRALSEILIDLYYNEFPFLHDVVGNAISAYNSARYSHYIRLDVKNFYPSVDHKILLNQLSSKIKKKEIIYLINNSIRQDTVANPSREKKWNEKGVPQGLSISNILANIYMIPIDSKHSSGNNYSYVRYVDDILVFCNEDQVDNIKNEIIDDCKNLQLTIYKERDVNSKSKVGTISDKFSYLGYSFSPENISVRELTKHKLRDSLIRILTIYKRSRNQNLNRLFWALNLRISGCVYDETKYGWVFYFSQITDMSLLKQLDIFLESQLRRFNIDSYQGNVKKFVRSYYEITRNFSRSNYIPKFDRYSVSDMRRLLTDAFEVTKEGMSEAEIRREFRWRIFRQVRELEQDLTRFS